MGKRKVQVTLDEVEYQELARLAERDGKKLAAVVRESIRRYLVPETEKAKREALRELFLLQARAPQDFRAWEREYSRLKAKRDGDPPPDSRAADRSRG